MAQMRVLVLGIHTLLQGHPTKSVYPRNVVENAVFAARHASDDFFHRKRERPAIPEARVFLAVAKPCCSGSRVGDHLHLTQKCLGDGANGFRARISRGTYHPNLA